jgi:transcriptional regulator with XRE-family HTH domain
MDTIGDRIKKWRKHINCKQKAFSELSGIPLSSLKGYESNKRAPGSGALAKFRATGVHTNWLLTGNGEMIASTKGSDSDLPDDLQEFEEGIQEMFRLLIEMEEPRRTIAVSEIVNKVKEAAMVDQMAKKLRQLEQER